MKRFVLFCFTAAVCVVATPACTPHDPSAAQRQSVIQPKPAMDALGLVFDMSGSFEQRMHDQGWDFAVKTLREFKRDTMGEDRTQVVLAQISGEPQGPIFDGSLRTFGKTIRGQEDFRKFLRSKSNASGSRVFDSIRETVDYIVLTAGDDTRSAVIILSDMDDNASGPGAEERLVQSFAALARKGGSVGIYFCDLNKVGRWNENLRRAGVKNFIVESQIASNPTMPRFEH